ncbi:amidohydrolase family protein [Falsiroseomonas selenitidurans]|uniref:Amidohydrolase n=1 Tax=Falsiroseomonas selenitidurans TaxID=2716335 RepID=A0ABX1DX74_9PROT|nr:amidohydrolase family protein [Falsiroseomonas selenitidurans]NKC29519.1 amidohydrolase [Falsiroseomonas selenitidurans]
MPIEIIDTHTHVISPDTARYPLAPLGGKQSDWSAERPTPPEALIAAMDEAGIARAVVVQASTAYGHDNSYLVESVAAHRDRFVGVFSVDILAEDAPARIRHWHAAGLSGFRLFTTGTTMPGQAGWLDDPRGFPGWAVAAELGLPVCLQMTAKGIPALRTLLARFPTVPVLLDHLARPDLTDGPPFARSAELFALAEHPQVFLKLTTRALDMAAAGASTPAALLQALLARFGAGRILWGSNFPAAEGTLAALLARSLAPLQALSEADRAAILGGTARRLYPALAPADV